MFDFFSNHSNMYSTSFYYEINFIRLIINAFINFEKLTKIISHSRVKISKIRNFKTIRKLPLIHRGLNQLFCVISIYFYNVNYRVEFTADHDII